MAAFLTVFFCLKASVKVTMIAPTPKLASILAARMLAAMAVGLVLNARHLTMVSDFCMHEM